MIEFLLLIITIFLTIASYAWSDYGFISLITQTKPIFSKLYTLRGLMLYNRHIAEFLFVTLIISLVSIQIYFLFTKKEKINLKIIIISLTILFFAYPFLSSDIFSYLFAGKIAYVYHLNPYKTIPEAFREKDIWLSFTYWTHRNYIYGPLYLLISIIPLVILGAEKFLTVFYLTKIISGLVFILTGLVIYRITKDIKKAIYLWWVNPLVIIELLINSHNDLFMIFFFLLSILLWDNKKRFWAIFSFISSVLTKYASAPFIILLFTKGKTREILSKVLLLLLLLFLGFKYPSFQAWYYTWIYFLIPLANLKKRSLLVIFLFQGLLILDKYYTFISSGNWGPINQDIRILFIFLPFITSLTLIRRRIKANSQKMAELDNHS